MNSRRIVTGLLLLTASLAASASAADASFQLVKQDAKVSVYGKKRENCVADGANVMFLVENRSQERLELKLELLNLKVKNRLTVMVEPSGNTSVLALSPDPEACTTELVDMQVSPVTPRPVKADTDEKTDAAAPGDRVM